MAAPVNAIVTMSDEDPVVGPSDRSFGFTFTGLFLAIGLFPLWRGAEPRWWLLGVAGLCGMIALVRPGLLAPANRAWLALGLLMHRVVNPIVMAAMFYLVVTPFGVLMRLVRPAFVRRLRRDPTAATYWIEREDTPSSMEQQF